MREFKDLIIDILEGAIDHDMHCGDTCKYCECISIGRSVKHEDECPIGLLEKGFDGYFNEKVS